MPKQYNKKNADRALSKALSETEASVNPKKNVPSDQKSAKKTKSQSTSLAKTHHRAKKNTNKANSSNASEQAIKDRIRRLSSNSELPAEKTQHPASSSGKAKNKNDIVPVVYDRDPYESQGLFIKKGDYAELKTVDRNARKGSKLRIIPLGGLGEVGKNITVIEYADDIIIVDCGLGFPDDDMPGVDIVIPDFSYLESRRDRIRGVVLTHGHEDHIGGIPYLLRSLNVPVYGTRLTLKIIENKLKEVSLPYAACLHCVEAGDTVRLGCFSVEFIRVNHSIADACCLAISTPVGMVIHSGDFKLDLTPIEGDIMNITRLGELGNRGVLLLMCESTNAERPGYTPSERTVGTSLEYIFTTNREKRLIISTFSSNVHRVQQIIDASYRHGRKVVITGRSMINIISAASELGYMNLPEGIIVDIGDMRRYRPEEITVVCTGSQGEPMSALYRMAFGDRTQITLDHNDVVVISATAIPGNEKLVGRIVNELCRRGVGVLNDPMSGVHVSGHACAEELKLMQALTKPKYFMPIHGEHRHLQANKLLALQMGKESRDIFVSEIGRVLELDKSSARFVGNVPAGNVLVDGSGVGEVGEIVLRDRRLLAQDGLIVVFASVELTSRLIITKPDIISRGFVYMKESEELIDEMRDLAAQTLSRQLSRKGNPDRMQIKNAIKDELSRFVYSRTKRKPMILPVIIDV